MPERRYGLLYLSVSNHVTLLCGNDEYVTRKGVFYYSHYEAMRVGPVVHIMH